MAAAAGGGGSGEMLFNGYRASVLQDERSFGDWIQDNINVLNTTDLKNGHYNKLFVICVLPQLKKMEEKSPFLRSTDIKIIGN